VIAIGSGQGWLAAAFLADGALLTKAIKTAAEQPRRLDHTWLANLTLRVSAANQMGLLGFGGPRGNYHLLAEGSVGMFVGDNMILGAEYRGVRGPRQHRRMSAANCRMGHTARSFPMKSGGASHSLTG
jgi:hypothetical protein